MKFEREKLKRKRKKTRKEALEELLPYVFRKCCELYLFIL